MRKIFPDGASWIRILGPVDLIVQGKALELRGSQRMAVLAFLTLHVGQPVPITVLESRLWGERDVCPRNVRTSLRNAVEHLRRLLAEADPDRFTIERSAAHYRLSVPPDAVDLSMFRELSASGRRALAEGDAEEADMLLGQALRLWRGPALAEFEADGKPWPESAELHEEHLSAVEDRAAARVACREFTPVVRDMQQLIDREPLRERTAALLMTALAGLGRGDEALAVFAETRQRLADGWGIDPGRDLQAAHDGVRASLPTMMPGDRPAWVPPSVADGPGQRQPQPSPAAVTTIADTVAATVLLLDVDGIPADPEEFAELLTAWEARIRRCVADFAGRVVSSLAGTIVVVFDGANHPRRAVRTALAVRALAGADIRTAPDNGSPGSHSLSASGALASGQVRCTGFPSVGGMATGAPVDECRRLRGAATSAGHVLVHESTYRASASDFAYVASTDRPGVYVPVATLGFPTAEAA